MNLRPEKTISDKARVFDVGGVSPTILATHYKDPPKILEERMEIKEIGNLKEGQQSWKSPQTGRVYDPKGISPTLNTCGGGGHEVKIVETKVLGGIYTDVTDNFNRGLYPDMSRTIKAVKNDAGCIERRIVHMRGRNPENPSDRTAGTPTEQRLEVNSEGICGTITTVQKDNMVLEKDYLLPGNNFNQRKVVHGEKSISRTIIGQGHAGNEIKILKNYRVRKLTPRETWRLMGFSDDDYEKAAEVNSKTQLYKQAGNSIVKDVLMAIFSQLNIKGVPMWNEQIKGSDTN